MYVNNAQGMSTVKNEAGRNLLSRPKTDKVKAKRKMDKAIKSQAKVMAKL